MSDEQPISTADEQSADLAASVAGSREDAIHRLLEEVRRAEQKAAEWVWELEMDENGFHHRYSVMILIGQAANMLETAYEKLTAT
jgi:hypothetical protein